MIQETLHLVGCNLELYYDARTHECQKCSVCIRQSPLGMSLAHRFPMTSWYVINLHSLHSIKHGAVLRVRKHSCVQSIYCLLWYEKVVALS